MKASILFGLMLVTVSLRPAPTSTSGTIEAEMVSSNSMGGIPGRMVGFCEIRAA